MTALDLSIEELAIWRARWRQGGFGALRVTRTQAWRTPPLGEART